MRFKSLIAATVASALTAVGIALAQTPGIPSTFTTVWTLAWEVSTLKPTYSASAAGITPVSSGNDICTLSGSATRTLRVRRVILVGSGATTAVTEPIAIVKRSTASTGAGTAITKVAYDSQAAASTATLAEVWTANPTAGTLVGVLADIPVAFSTAGGINPGLFYEFGTSGGSAAVLRGAAQSISINTSGITLTGTLGCTFEWTEEQP